MNALPTLLIPTSGIGALAAEGGALPAAHTNLQLEGWTVRVDGRLGSGDGAALGRHAVKLLTATLVCLAVVVPGPARAKLRAVTIQLDLNPGRAGDGRAASRPWGTAPATRRIDADARTLHAALHAAEGKHSRLGCRSGGDLPMMGRHQETGT